MSDYRLPIFSALRSKFDADTSIETPHGPIPTAVNRRLQEIAKSGDRDALESLQKELIAAVLTVDELLNPTAVDFGLETFPAWLLKYLDGFNTSAFTNMTTEDIASQRYIIVARIRSHTAGRVVWEFCTNSHCVSSAVLNGPTMKPGDCWVLRHNASTVMPAIIGAKKLTEEDAASVSRTLAALYRKNHYL